MSRTFVYAAAALLCATPAFGQLRPIQQLNVGLSNPNSNNAQDGFTITSRGSLLAAVWADQAGTGSGTQDIYFAASADEGLTWSLPSRVDVGDPANSADSSFPQIAICDDPSNPAGVVYVVAWEESRLYGTGNDDVFVSRSSDGMTWTTPIPLNLGAGMPTSDIDELWLAGAGTAAYVVWEEDGLTVDDCGNELLYFSRTLDAGLNWDVATQVNTQIFTGAGPCDYVDIDNPTVVAQGNRVVISWVDAAGGDDDVWIATSNAKGAPGSFVMGPIESSQVGDIDEPELAIDGNTVAVAWQDDELLGADLDEIHVAVSTDGGITWQPEINVTPSIALVPNSGTTYHDVAVSGTNLYVAFCSDHAAASLIIPSTGQPGAPASGEESEDREAYVSSSTDLGQSWTYEYPLDPGRANQFTRIKARGKTALVHLEADAFGNNELAYAVTNDGGASFQFFLNEDTVPGDVDSRGTRQGENFTMTDSLIGQSVYWTNAPFFQNEMFTAGIRVPYVHFTGAPSAGTNFSFGVRGASNVPAGSQFFVFLSVSPASITPINAKVLMPLTFDAITFLTLSNPAALALLSGPLDAQGNGDGITFPWPAGVAPGLNINACALIVTGGGAPIFTSDAKVLTTQ